ncbi:hypothetical protein AB1L42_19280 [Thalassoglobus sp. JC818]|uniref:hypothetical protein n=1 Tax=Thalassoglobus sp. JC818 TaxID=3232136 RepID=UPI003457F343
MKREVLDTGIVKEAQYQWHLLESFKLSNKQDLRKEIEARTDTVCGDIQSSLCELLINEFQSIVPTIRDRLNRVLKPKNLDPSSEVTSESMEFLESRVALMILATIEASLDDAFKDPSVSEDAQRLAMNCYVLGRFIERIVSIRPIEPQVKKHRDGSNKGKVKRTGGGDLSMAETVRAYQEAVSKNPKAKFAKIVQIVVECRQKLDHEKTRPVERSIRRHLREAKDPITGEKTPITPESHDSALE